MLGAGKWKTLADVELKREKKNLKNHIYYNRRGTAQMDDRTQHFIQIGSGLEIIVPFLVFKGILELSQITI